MNNPKCFGTKEYHPNNSICNRCKFYKECGRERKKHLPVISITDKSKKTPQNRLKSKFNLSRK